MVKNFTNSWQFYINNFIYLSMNFKENQHIVCPSHGLGKVIEVQEIESPKGSVSCYKISFGGGLINFVPTFKTKTMGIRGLCSKEIAMKVFNDVLKKPGKSSKGIWNKRSQEYDVKVGSGSILLAAEVIRDLFSNVKESSRSYSERVIYEKAFERVCGELAVVLETSEEEMDERMVKTMSDALFSKPAEVVKLERDDFDDSDSDLEEFEEESDIG